MTKKLSTQANVLLYSLGQFFALCAQWVLLIIIMQVGASDPDKANAAAGLLGIAMSLAPLFCALGIFQTTNYQLSDVTHEYSLGEYLGFRFIMLCASAAVCIVYCLLTLPLDSVWPVFLFFCSRAVYFWGETIQCTDQQNKRNDYVGISLTLQGLSTIVLFALTYSLTQNLNLSFIAITLGPLAVLLLYDRHMTSKFEPVKLVFSKTVFKTLFKTCALAAFGAIAFNAIAPIPRQYLLIHSGNEALGIYSQATSIAIIAQWAIIWIYTPLLGDFAKAFFSNNKRGFLLLLLKTFAIFCIISLLLTALLVWVGPLILPVLYGESITPHLWLLFPSIIAGICAALLCFFGDLQVALRNLKASFFGNAFAFVMVLPLSFIAVDAFSLNGANLAAIWAALAGICLHLVLLFIRVKKGPQKNQRLEASKQIGNTEAEEMVERLDQSI